MAVFYSFVAALFCGTVAIAGTIPLGGPCDPSAVHLDPQTHRLVTDCDDTTFCLASPYPSNSSSLTTGGSCQPRRCRRDEFPFGFQDLDADAAEARALPPLCPRGSFCPDVESGCLPLVPPGGACEMARDEQCALPPAAGGVGRTPSDAHAEEVYASPMQRRRRTALCLNLICMYANATLGQRCIIDQALYAESAPDGRSFNISVVRDNCVRPRFFCDGASTACASTKGLGAPCVRDGECESDECSAVGVCADPPWTPVVLAAWHYTVSGGCVFAAMVAVSTFLIFVHKRHWLERQRDLTEYYREQVRLRESMRALHSVASDGYYTAQKH